MTIININESQGERGIKNNGFWNLKVDELRSYFSGIKTDINKETVVWMNAAGKRLDF